MSNLLVLVLVQDRVDGDDRRVQGGLVHRHLAGHDAANLPELRHGEPVAAERVAHGEDLLVSEGHFAVQVLDLRRHAQFVQEEGERVDAEDGARHVLQVVNIRRLR